MIKVHSRFKIVPLPHLPDLPQLKCPLQVCHGEGNFMHICFVSSQAKDMPHFVHVVPKVSFTSAFPFVPNRPRPHVWR